MRTISLRMPVRITKRFFQSFSELKNQANTFLECGSGLGVATIMASRIGYEAYGIEAKSSLVEYSTNFSNQLGCDAVFANGSFIPDEFEWNPATTDEPVRTFIDVPAAFDALEMSLQDFDLIYAYPWPTEYSLYLDFFDSVCTTGRTFFMLRCSGRYVVAASGRLIMIPSAPSLVRRNGCFLW